MDYLIHKLLTHDLNKRIKQVLLENNTQWEDGKKTAGSFALKVKSNYQLNKESQAAIELGNIISQSIRDDQLLKSFSLPRKIHSIMFTKTSSGEGYGDHIDNAYMSSGRSDLSFTIFLSPKDSYKGGELCIQTIQDVKEIKLEAGEIIIYPSTSLHSVKQVSYGERLACVGWIQSYVASNEDRSLLFSLDAGAKGLLAKHGRSSELDLVFQAYSNLLRRLGD